jgi:hypothetical protein
VAETLGGKAVTDPPPPAPATIATFTVERIVTSVLTETVPLTTVVPATIDTSCVPRIVTPWVGFIQTGTPETDTEACVVTGTRFKIEIVPLDAGGLI